MTLTLSENIDLRRNESKNRKKHTKSYLTKKFLQHTFDDDTWHYLDNKTDHFIFKEMNNKEFQNFRYLIEIKSHFSNSVFHNFFCLFLIKLGN